MPGWQLATHLFPRASVSLLQSVSGAVQQGSRRPLPSGASHGGGPLPTDDAHGAAAAPGEGGLQLPAAAGDDDGGGDVLKAESLLKAFRVLS